MLTNISDLITLGRIFAVPAIVFCSLFSSYAMQYLAWYLFVLAALSDILDGYLARKYKLSSKFGSLFDSYADKVLVIVMLFLLVVLGKLTTTIQILPAFIITFRELLILLLRLYAFMQNINFGVSYTAKLKTFTTILGITILLHPALSLIYKSIGIISLWVAAVLAIFSGIEYLHQILKLKAKQNK